MTTIPSSSPGSTSALLTKAGDAFEFIRLKLINCLEEPQRSAFWKAVEMRDALRQISDGRLISRGNANVGDRIGRTRRPAHPMDTISGGPIGPSEVVLDPAQPPKAPVIDPADEAYYEGYEQARSDMVLHPLAEIREWDEALALLGIQDSDQTPADAIRELNAEIERLSALATPITNDGSAP